MSLKRKASEGMAKPEVATTTRWFIAFLAGLGLFAVIVFWPAGRMDWLAGWLYLGLVTANLFVNFVYLRRVNPEVIEHRLRLGKGTKRWDKLWGVLFTPVFLAIYVIAGCDAVRFEWSTMSFFMAPGAGALDGG